ncbi:MAG: hypothetical protein LBU85_12990 [Treponema sp.]|nr:hypothetical protein [Treponema sp.]
MNEDGEIEKSAVLDAVDYAPPVEGLGVNQEKILEILQKTGDKKLMHSDLLEAWKKETGKRKGHLDQALDRLEHAGLVHYETGFVCLGRQPEVKIA